MKLPLASYLLLATRDAFRDMGSGFRDKREAFEPSDLLVWAAVIIALCVLLVWLSRILARDQRQSFNNPRALFKCLSKVHGLDRTQRTVLRQIARQHDLTPAARLFLEPEWFDIDQLSPALQEKRNAIESLRVLLFATDQPDEIHFGRAKGAQAAEPEPAIAGAGENTFVGLPVELPATYGPLRYEPRVRD